MTTVTLQGTREPFVVSKIVCVGRNYAKHAREMKSDIPTTPMLFLKPPSAVIHNHGHIIIPPISKDLHHEVEMTVLVGKAGINILPEKAMEHIAGYGIGLDMTLRDVQSEAKSKGNPWAVAKGFNTSAPLSDFVPASSIKDPHALRVELTVNGALRQSGSTSDFIFRLDRLLSTISQYFALEPGDVVYTGTPEGVGQTVPGDTLLARLLDHDGTALASVMAHVQ